MVEEQSIHNKIFHEYAISTKILDQQKSIRSALSYTKRFSKRLKDFGGTRILLSGDFRQTLPVIYRGLVDN